MFLYRRLILFLLLTMYIGSLLHTQESNQQLTFVRGEDIILFDVDSGTETLLLADVDPAHYDSSWSPDGSKLAFMVGDYDSHRDLTVLDTPSGEIYQPAMDSGEVRGASIGAYSWSPYGQWIAYNLHYYDPEHEQEVNEFYVIAPTRESQPSLLATLV